MSNVIVTGASRGLGLAIAETLATAGYQVIAVARQAGELLPAASARAQAGARGAIHFRACDLTATEQLAALVGAVRKEFGPLYGLVNNAGIGTSGMLTMMRDVQVEQLVRLNTIAPILLAKYAVRSMMLEKRGRIINMASIVASTGYHGLAAYSATKASLIGFTRSLAREVGPLGITVNAIAPGFIETEMTQELAAAQREQIARRSALKRLAGAEDVAALVEFLLSEKAKNITGTTLTVDAGNTA